MTNVEIKTVPMDDADLHMLISKLDEELLTRYPAEGIFGVDFSDPKVRYMTFWVAYVGGAPAGCGALRPLGEGTGEIKRFFVDGAFRRGGIASAILAHIERNALASGIRTLLLETGPRQPEAISLYSKFGYREIPAYGEYIGCEHSYCMEKVLSE